MTTGSFKPEIIFQIGPVLPEISNSTKQIFQLYNIKAISINVPLFTENIQPPTYTNYTQNLVEQK